MAFLLLWSLCTSTLPARCLDHVICCGLVGQILVCHKRINVVGRFSIAARQGEIIFICFIMKLKRVDHIIDIIWCTTGIVNAQLDCQMCMSARITTHEIKTEQ